jgi:hypothetical protein
MLMLMLMLLLPLLMLMLRLLLPLLMLMLLLLLLLAPPPPPPPPPVYDIISAVTAHPPHRVQQFITKIHYLKYRLCRPFALGAGICWICDCVTNTYSEPRRC